MEMMQNERHVIENSANEQSSSGQNIQEGTRRNKSEEEKNTKKSKGGKKENKAKNSKGGKKKKRRMSDFQYFALQTLLIVIVIYVLFSRMVGITAMPGGDMYPRIDSGDMLLFYRLDRDPKAQDVVVLEKNNTRYVSRVIATGGDTVDISEDGVVKVNGYTMVETNIFFETYPLEGFTAYPVTLEADECFVLADQRGGSEDSRFFGPVKYKEIQGTVITVLRRNNL